MNRVGGQGQPSLGEEGFFHPVDGADAGASLQDILDHSPAVIQVKDLAGRYLLVNWSFEQCFGLRRQEVLGKTPQHLFPPDIANALQNHDRQVLEAGGPLEFEEVLPQDGELHTYISIKFPLLNPAGGITSLCGISTDITARKRAELALRQSQERLALMVLGSNDGVWDWDLATNEVFFSGRWKSMLGYQDHEVPNHFSAWEQLLHPEDRARAMARLKAYLSGEIPSYELEHRLRHKDGTYRWILSRGVALRDAQGRPTRMAGSHVDLTERREAQERLQQALQALQAANRELKTAHLQLIQAAKLESIGTLAAGVAHEVKNPLQIILMGLDYLVRQHKDGNGSPDLTLVLTDMRDAVNRANWIVRELLQLSAATDFDLKPGNLNEIIQRSLWLVKNEIVASHVTVEQTLDPNLPLVRLDRTKIEQVFINLFINALQAMTGGGVLGVTTGFGLLGPDLVLDPYHGHPWHPGDSLVLAHVTDTGAGIPEDILPRIYDPFFTTKPVGVGTGLGLPIVNKIIELHGGFFDVRNRPTGGVVATILLQAQTPNNPSSTVQDAGNDPAGANAPPAAPGQKGNNV